ncbi:unnamed protein product [Gongylonema pulchrum]|uniref:DNA-directed RNA polymerase n=1 Tax=Gongylonema pulchrum TaxID=637853 RepID=A0A183DZJ9_9BILA|nr:unnamed protein product [Gongylonema pulchrum]
MSHLLARVSTSVIFNVIIENEIVIVTVLFCVIWRCVAVAWSRCRFKLLRLSGSSLELLQGGSRVEVEMHDRTHDTGKFMAIKANQTHYIVDSLKTPIRLVKSDALRMDDTLVTSTDVTDVLSHF